MRVLVIGKPDPQCAAALSWWRQSQPDAEIVAVETSSDPRWPSTLQDWAGDYLISYRCGAIVPAEVLVRASRAAINFHPGPPEYPGTGCVNFALYDNAPTFGATCHHMAPQVDAGPIIDVVRFPLTPYDSVESTLQQTYVHMLGMFYRLVTCIRDGHSLPASPERWSGVRRTRAALNDLAVLTPDMTQDELARRIRATTHHPWYPVLRIHGMDFAPRLPHS